jgi:Predicted branched-chain amino acid permease (azaleucine resistance)
MKSKDFGRTLRFVVKNTYAIGISWIPIALAFGMIVKNAGYNAAWTALSGVLCPFGTLQMVSFSFVASNVAWGAMLATSLAVSCRHVFYGLSFIEKFKKFGPASGYMIYMLCDELYSVYCGVDIPDDLDEKQVYLTAAGVLQLYWVALTIISTLIGALIPFDLSGIDFALTALFTVIFIDMFTAGKTKIPAVAGAICGIVCFLIFGAENFLMPALILVCFVLLIMKKQIAKGSE